MILRSVLLSLFAIALMIGVQSCGGGSGSPSGDGTTPPVLEPSEQPTQPGSGALVPPQGFMLPVARSAAVGHACPNNATPYTGPMDFPSRYEGSDEARDDINEDAERRYRELTAPIAAFERGLSQQVDDYLRSGREESLTCAMDLLRSWSSAQALMGTGVNLTGKAVRKWALGSIGGAYLRVKFSSSHPLERDPVLEHAVDAWVGMLATLVMAEWANAPLRSMNNHEYWAAWATMASAVALDRRDLFDWSMSQFDIAMTQVDAEGYLPNELARDTRALWYHNYALMPLSMIAAFATANGDAPDAQARAALSRLSGRVLSGADDPAAFRDKTGKVQADIDLYDKDRLVWLEPFCWTFVCSPAAQVQLDGLRPMELHRLGGNLTEIFHPQRGDASRSARATDSRPTT